MWSFPFAPLLSRFVSLISFIRSFFLHLLFTSSDALGNCFTLTNWWYMTKAAAIFRRTQQMWRTKCVLYIWMWALNKRLLLCYLNVYVKYIKPKRRHRIIVWVYICVCVYVCVRTTERGERKRHSIHVAHSSFSVGVRLQANQVLVKCALCKLFSVISIK